MPIFSLWIIVRGQNTLITKVKKKIGRIIGRISDHRSRKYISYKDAIRKYFLTYNAGVRKYKIDEIKKSHQSDTIFILGNGPSLNELTSEQIKHINENNSFGLAYSFVKKEIIPTYYKIIFEERIGYEYWINLFASYRKAYNNVIVCLSSKQNQRLMHPRLMPEVFPEKTKYYCYQQPDAIQLAVNRPFEDGYFEKSLLYRNVMSLILDIVVRMGYEKIVLLGVDLDNWAYFYENLPEMKEYVEERIYKARPDMKKGMKFDTMYPKGNKYHPFDVYLYALSDYLKRKRNITLYIGKKDNSLFPGLPAYFE